MDRSVAHVVFLEKLSDEDCLSKDQFERLDRVVLGGNVENGLVLVVPQLETSLGHVAEVFLYHWLIILLQAIVQRKRAIVVDRVKPGSDFVDQFMLLVQTDDMLDSLACVVLLASCLEELIVTTEPVEHLLVAVPRAFKQWVLTEVVLD